jgi:hypothetical protein
MKAKLLAISLLAGGASLSNAANFAINNVAAGVGDTLYASSANVPLNGAIVTLGVFTAGFDVNANLNNPAALVANFTTIFAQGLTGNESVSLGGSFAGYAEYETVDGAIVTGANALLGRTLYSFIGNAATLGASTEFGLLNMGLIKDDVPNENDYSANPGAAVAAPLLGTLDTVNGDFGGGAGVYNTLKLAPAIPEPSVALLGLLGAVGFFRRRR